MFILSWLKESLSHVRESTWHYQMVHGIWGDRTRGKACYYYWLKMPSSVVAWPIVIVVAFVLVSLFTVIAWFVGYIPTLFETEDDNLNAITPKDAMFYPYGYTSKGVRRRVMPWLVAFWLGVLAVIAAFGWLIYYWSTVNQSAGIDAGLKAAIFAAGSVICVIAWYVLTRKSSQTFLLSRSSWLVSRWDGICPPLVVSPKE